MLELRFEPSEMARFGKRIARLNIEQDKPDPAVDDILALCRAERIDMLTLRVPTRRLQLVQNLEANSFQLMDCLVYYGASTLDSPVLASQNFLLRECTAADTDAVSRIALSCFADYFSHYHADPRLDRRKVCDGFVDWARRSCIDRAVATTVFLPIVEGRVAGFATMRRNGELEGEGVLFGVHPEYAGLGVYGALIDRGKQWCRENGMSRMIVSTQLDNLRVQTSWVHRGFRLFRSLYTFHRWFV